MHKLSKILITFFIKITNYILRNKLLALFDSSYVIINFIYRWSIVHTQLMTQIDSCYNQMTKNVSAHSILVIPDVEGPNSNQNLNSTRKSELFILSLSSFFRCPRSELRNQNLLWLRSRNFLDTHIPFLSDVRCLIIKDWNIRSQTIYQTVSTLKHT